MHVVFSLTISSKWCEHRFCSTTEINEAAPHPSRVESVWHSIKYKKRWQLRVVSALLSQERLDLWSKVQCFNLRPVYMMVSKLNVTEIILIKEKYSLPSVTAVSHMDTWERSTILTGILPLIFPERTKINRRQRSGRNKQSCHTENGKTTTWFTARAWAAPLRETPLATVFGGN